METNSELSTQPLESLAEYQNSTLLPKLRKQTISTPPAIGFTDFDGTISVKSKDPNQQAKYDQAVAQLDLQLNKDSIPLIAVTGSDLFWVNSEKKFAIFDAVAAAVGTEIWVRQTDGTYIMDQEYKRYIEETIGFDRDKIWDLARVFKDKLNSEEPQHKLRFQTRDLEQGVAEYRKSGGVDPQQPYKISFHFEGDLEGANNLREQFLKQLGTEGYGKIQVVVCQSSSKFVDGKPLWNLDLVPVTKAQAIDFMVKKYGCSGVVAGDSGNDESMIFEGGDNARVAGVVVGNAKEELTKAIEQKETVRETGSFRTVKSPKGTPRLIYVEPDKTNIGPTSLLRAVHAFRLFNATRSK